MVDIVTNVKTFQGGRRLFVHLTCESDGTGETKVVKVNLDDLKTFTGERPGSLSLIRASGNLTGFKYVTLYWDRPADPQMIVLSGQGQFDQDFKREGGKRDPQRDQGGTGNILLTSDTPVDGASYDIHLEFKLKR